MKDVIIKTKVYKCPYCNKVYKSGRSLSSHHKWCKSGPHREKSLTQNRGNINTDNSIHDKIEIVNCKYCNKSFTSIRKCNGHKSGCNLNPNKRDNSACQLGKRKHSKESRLKISEARKKVLSENPHLNIQHYGPSKPELYLINKMREWKFNITPQYSDSRWMRGFKIDIYLPDYQIGLEINGQFKYKDGKIKSYYQKRSKVILDTSGIRIIDIHYSKVYNITKEELQGLIMTTQDTNNEVNDELPEVMEGSYFDLGQLAYDSCVAPDQDSIS